jgi:hypothetical protein
LENEFRKFELTAKCNFEKSNMSRLEKGNIIYLNSNPVAWIYTITEWNVAGTSPLPATKKASEKSEAFFVLTINM